MSQKDPGRREFSLRERFRYWFDNRMAKGSLGLIRTLIAASILLAVVIAFLIVVCGFSEDGDAAGVFWDSIATVINAWMPYYEDGGPGYLLLMTVTAVAGVLFTSVLIGIVTSAIEEKIIDLKKGNSRILERDHTVILGFCPGEYTLLRQLILAAGGEPACVVVADELERDEMEQSIRDNVDVPKNFRVICRTCDIFDPTSLEKCSIDTCRNVIVSPMDDTRTVKALLAVYALLRRTDADVRVSAILSSDAYRFPPTVAERYRISTLLRNDTLARMIAHSCTQMGLADTFRQVFNFEGAELYIVEIPGAAGLRFDELTVRLDRAVPVGVAGADGIRLVPPGDTMIGAGERIVIFAEESCGAVLTDAGIGERIDAGAGPAESGPEAETDAVILGHNESLPVILRELPENVTRVVLAGKRGTEEERAELERIAAARGMSVATCDGDTDTEEGLLEIARQAEHIVLLNDHDADEEEADLEAVFLLLHLRDLRERYGLKYNITTEMRRENNQNLVAGGDGTDFIVASSMSALLLAQLAESPELRDVFREMLSNEGCELFLKNAGSLRCDGALPVRELRRRALRQGYALLGCIGADGESVFDPPLDEILALRPEDKLIVFGEH